eukprot:CAMPEP_0182482984 /NCGR_PEP_ID=MMETSP1319-20130603/40352_1 /TAXON_ID=172717 /ORGANISM="Bolidomonas pacifica, Strain RCC208" /LENGTH=281 /DNA_ID=CAMNT_0024684741 /DNA_START=230 /DNA_END=1072 /DNA_ORIENTATION=+
MNDHVSRWSEGKKPGNYSPEKPRREYIDVEEGKRLWNIGPLKALKSLFVERSKMTLKVGTIFEPCSIRGSVLCNDRSEVSGFRRFTLFVSVAFGGLINASPDLCTNVCTTCLQSVGLGLAMSCDRSQTGLIPKSYDPLTLHHLSKLSTFSLAALVGQVLGACGGRYLLADAFITFHIPVAGSSYLLYPLVSASSLVYRLLFLSVLSLATTTATRISFECNTGRLKSTISGWCVFMLILLCLSNFGVLFIFQLFNFTVSKLIVWEPMMGTDAATSMVYYTEE